MTNLAVIILTFNEEIHIARAIESVKSISSEIVIVDSGSTDRTAEIARAHGATVLTHPFENQAKQFNWALDNASIQAEWVMRLDADEIIEPDLAAALLPRISELPVDVCGINLKRKHIFLGRWVRFGGRYPIILLRIWRNGTARSENRWMDEHMMLLRGHSITIEGGFCDHNLKDLTYFTEKHNNYATREALEVILNEIGLFTETVELNASHKSIKIKKFVKKNLYNRIPPHLAAIMYFLYRYIIRLGFLDSRSGRTYHVLQGFWYRYLVASKLLEFRSSLAGLSQEDARAYLEQIARLDLSDFRRIENLP